MSMTRWMQLNTGEAGRAKSLDDPAVFAGRMSSSWRALFSRTSSIGEAPRHMLYREVGP